MKRRRLKKEVYYVFAGLIILIIALTSLIKHINYTHSYEYKFLKLGYEKAQVEVILTLKDKELDKLLKHKYDKNITSFIKQKYFIFNNLDRYLKYQKENKSTKLKDIVSIVNVHADYEWYDEDAIKDTDTSKGTMMLVNKFYHLNENYAPENIVDASKTYAYDENSATEETLSAFKKMWVKAKSEDINLIITSSYRTYKDQDKIWNSYAIRNSEEWADAYAARAGYSEHQTGMALDIVTYKSTMDNFDETPEAKWLADNAYKYGFILRYPKGKENLTGYDYEPWHYRYVGVENAKKIYKEGITFEEYYAYYVENKD